MTDYDKLKALLNEFGVKYEETIDDLSVGPSDEILDENVKTIVVINDDECKKIAGYHGFYTCFDFTNEGKFIQMGAWE